VIPAARVWEHSPLVDAEKGLILDDLGILSNCRNFH